MNIATSTVGITRSLPMSFPGKSNSNIQLRLPPRQLRAIAALLVRPHSREELDLIVGTSNSPDTVYRLRKQGFDIPVSRAVHVDRDGRKGHHGIYRLSARDWERLGGVQ